MKKVVSIILCLFISICILDSSFADDEFTLRNGILFGDTMDDILSKETVLEREGDDSRWFKGKIAGYNNARCGFYFDENEKLVSMSYDFSESCYNRESTDDVYKKLYQSLVRQYGKAKGNTGGTTYIITGPAFERMALWVYLLGALDKCAGNYYDYDEWVVYAKDYQVKIDLISYYYRNSDYEYSYFCDLSYHKFTDDELDTEIQKKKDEENEVDDDL